MHGEDETVHIETSPVFHLKALNVTTRGKKTSVRKCLALFHLLILREEP